MPDWRVLVVALVALFLLAPPAAPPPQPESFANLVRKVLPSVVNISVKGRGQGPSSATATTGGTPEKVAYAPQIVDIVGSGSIVDSSGLIVTNRHVIENAYEIVVTLQDGTTANARLLGKGLSFDLAVLKIDVGRSLPAIKVGNSDELQVGDRVFAIGNPLGLQGTVTSGIVSAKHRDLSGPYDEFIQTDAAINHGNSGGPLFNTKGEVIGINNQIFSDSPTSGSIGLGFAIPSNDVQFLLKQIHRYGRPHIGWLGLRVQAVTPEIAETLRVSKRSGALVSEVMAGSPAAVAGVQIGDIIQGFAHEAVSDYREFNRAVMMSVGKTMKVRVWRKGETRVVSMRVKEWPQEVWESYKSGTSRESLFTKLADYGFDISDVNDDLRSRFKLDPQVRGPVVTSVTEDTAASGAKLKPGDVVLTVQMEEVHSREDFEQRLADLCTGGQRNALLFVKGANGPRWLTLPLRL
ncbi:MAG: serine protease Do [Methylobacteriaceae bacterium]|jgi:serine protease Do|nr:serine protease Do [Methylobacteriaceae bacterium]